MKKSNKTHHERIVTDGKVVVHFDGGRRQDPNRGVWIVYGSYKIGEMPPKSLRFRPEATSAEAEYLSLLNALEELPRMVVPSIVDLDVYGDSRVVIHCLSGINVCRRPNVRAHYDRIVELLKEYRSVQLNWIPRENMVAIFGH